MILSMGTKPAIHEIEIKDDGWQMLGDREKQAIEQGPDLSAVLDHIEFLRDANANIDQPYVLELRSLSEGTPSSLLSNHTMNHS